MTDDLYCSIFIDFNGPETELSKLITDLVKGREEIFSEILCTWGEISLGKNMDAGTASPEEEKVKEKDFLFYRFKLEIEPAVGIDALVYIQGISRLLEDLWRQNISATAACHFEDDLPEGGAELRS